ncbi:MAG: hypothetical protein IT429_15135 [Gemmataceae bacterium]|nr:hypothetical protein [Gemmataceae bacterium]
MRSERAAPVAGLILTLLAVTGCGSSAGQVSGTVKVNGVPIKDGAITFIPADGKGQTAGDQIKDGRYSARVPVGRAKVMISGSKVVGKKKLYDAPDSPTQDVTEEIVPPKYNVQTTLEYEVTSGSNTKDWDLKGK